MKGYTFVELLISAVIFAVLALSIFSAFYAGIFGNRNISESVRLYQTVVQAFEWIDSDVRNSIMFSKDQSGFEGDVSSMRFLSITGTYREGSLQRDFSSVSYKLEGDRLLRQCRINSAALNTVLDSGFEEVASGIKEAVFRYAKPAQAGTDIVWLEEWHESDALPAAVGIRLVLEERNSGEFERTIYLPLAR